MVLVSVVGDFDSGLLPVFYYHVESLKVHILLHDRKDAAKARRLQEGMKRFCAHYAYEPKLLLLPYDEDSEASIAAAAKRISSYGGQIVINPTEGLSTTAVLLHARLAPHGGTMVEYDRKENGFNLLEEGRIRSEMVSPMTVPEHLMLKNVAVEIRPDMHAVMARRQLVEVLLEDSVRFMEFRNAYNKHRGRVTGYEDIKALLREGGVLEDRSFIDGGIFEERCFHLLNALPFDDVQLGVVATFHPDTPRAFKNEFDVLCIKDNHLHIVECKFRSRIDGEALIYKYDSIMDLVDEDARAVMAVVGGENVQIGKNGRTRQSFYEGTQHRARHNDIMIYQERRFDPQRFQDEVGAFLLG